MIPNGVRLTSYGGQAADLPADVFARQLQAIAAERLKVPVAKVYHGLEQVPEAQANVESGTTPGKHVVVPGGLRPGLLRNVVRPGLHGVQEAPVPTQFTKRE
ncbi:zinc-binding dehydrogenase [Streptomyces europaeiscabiei]|uniref:Zinc-binding dehydrogenase n=1 Tax=Streptomyces europaeiscabiei TaxID=146819 RepID=A0AAJ2PJW9_9ACTN|nr:zinc-binding dehydrogenase [Streptomyces europaeiscabiei]